MNLVSDNEEYLEYLTPRQHKLEPLKNKNSDNFLNNFNKKYSEDQPINTNNNHNNFQSHFDDLTPLNTNLDLNLVKDEPDFVMNSNGRLTEMKSLKTIAF